MTEANQVSQEIAAMPADKQLELAAMLLRNAQQEARAGNGDQARSAVRIACIIVEIVGCELGAVLAIADGKQ